MVKVFRFPLTRLVLGVLVVLGAVALGEFIKQQLAGPVEGAHPATEFFASLFQVALAVTSYIVLFRFYEKRNITEMGLANFPRHALAGFSAGLIIQSLAVLVLFLTGGYQVLRVNGFSSLLPGITFGMVAGLVAEIFLRGIGFRLLEEWLGTTITLVGFFLLFIVMHIRQPGATVLSVCSIAAQGGLLLSAAWVFTKNLWMPIFLHFAWDLAEPGIFGGANPGTTLDKSILVSRVSGSPLVTGGPFGPGSSLQAAICCLVLSAWLLGMAWQKNKFIPPSWKRHPGQ
jgi:membrane protease YdiL (CAAX protease family)